MIFHFFYHTACPHCGMWLLVEECDTTKDDFGIHAYHDYCEREFDISE